MYEILGLQRPHANDLDLREEHTIDSEKAVLHSLPGVSPAFF